MRDAWVARRRASWSSRAGVMTPGTPITIEPDGTWVGAAVTTDRRLIEYARNVKEHVWSLAVPLLEYSDK